MLPVVKDLLHAIHNNLPEHVGMAADQLGPNASHYIRHSKIALLLGNLRVHEDLKKQVPEFFLNPAQIRSIERLKHLVRLLKHVLAQRMMRLFPVPWTSVGCAQVGHRILKRLK